MGLGVGDSGCRLEDVPGNEGDLVGCSDGLLNEGVAGEYWSRALICWEWDIVAGRCAMPVDDVLLLFFSKNIVRVARQCCAKSPYPLLRTSTWGGEPGCWILGTRAGGRSQLGGDRREVKTGLRTLSPIETGRRGWGR